jgi:acylphosphatase
MKLEVRVTGPRVHEVGYRLHLLDLAILYDINRFSVNRLIEDGKQVVIARVEGSNDQLQNFLKDIENKIPAGAEVVDIANEPFQEYIGPTIAAAWELLSKEK